MNRHPATAFRGPRPGRGAAPYLPLLQRAAIRAGETAAVSPIVHDVLCSPGEPLDAAARAALEPRFGHDFSQVRVHTDAQAAKSAHALGALAYTAGHHVIFGSGQYALGTEAGERLLAPELTHVVQQWPGAALFLHAAQIPGGLAVGRAGDGLEREADRAGLAVTGEPGPRVVIGAGRAGALVQRQMHVQSPLDRQTVERARLRLALLERFIDEWTVREARRLQIGEERNRLLASRTRMDREGIDIGRPGARAATEEENLGSLNRRPLDIQVTDDAVRIRIRFHVRFEDPRMASRLNDLRAGLQAGIDLVWNQALGGQTFSGRRLVIEPITMLVSPTAARDLRYWLITVRPTDQSPATYPGCTFDPLPPGTPTSATMPDCAGGVMSVPPAHITLGGVLGHEVLHLFGLVDRYVMLTSVRPRGRTVTETDPTRDTRGRLDPLGGQDAPILAEDLAFLFDRLDIFELEAGRGLGILRRLEREGLTFGAVRGEMVRLREIIELGYDPRSLIRPRRDFNDKIIRELENL